MRTVMKMLKYELKLVKKEIEEDSAIVHSNSDSYPIKYIRKRNRNNEKYRDELIHEISLLKQRTNTNWLRQILGAAFDAGIKAQDLRKNEVRAWDDFEDYYNKFKENENSITGSN